MKPIVKIILRILGTLAWVAAFLLIGFMLIIANFGPVGRVGGGVFFWILLFLGFACFSAPLTLRFFVKKHWLRVGICAGIAVLLFALLVGTAHLANAYLADFTQEKWQRYPRDRYMMLEDLKKNHDIIGMSTEEVIALLGEPNVKSDKAYTYYCSENSYSGLWQVEFQLEDSKVVGIRKFYYEGEWQNV
ncbi:MAG: hypothetical protein FWF10_04685 [Clostridiales bacterium]|nr:hypothetical protein [Clostridiales bacterium]